jgi:cytochrome c oxidase assembly protein subunit 15
MDFASGFSWHGLGVDYQGGILDNPARVAIHWVHRLGAGVTLLVLGALCIQLFRSGDAVLNKLSVMVSALLLLQIGLGISMVEFGWPLPVADLHNGVAALLLAAVVAVNWAVRADKTS